MGKKNRISAKKRIMGIVADHGGISFTRHSHCTRVLSSDVFTPLHLSPSLPHTYICMSSALTAAHLIDPVWQCISQLKRCWFNWAGQNQPMPENESIKEAIGASEAEAIRAVNQSRIPCHCLLHSHSTHSHLGTLWGLNADAVFQPNGSIAMFLSTYL